MPLVIGLISWNRKARLITIFLLTIFLALTLSYWVHPHYAAPATIVFIAIVVTGLRRIYTLRSLPDALRITFVVAMAASPVFAAGSDLLNLLVRQRTSDFALGVFPKRTFIQTGYTTLPEAWPIHRQRILNQLAQTKRKHLILVRYRSGHDLNDEWVYNEPDIDRAPVVWAREWNPEEDARLIKYFRDREVWLLEADRFPYRLQPYSRPHQKNIASCSELLIGQPASEKK